MLRRLLRESHQKLRAFARRPSSRDNATPTRYLSAQKVDASIACKVINRMTSLGMPVSRKVA
jgi:hypothetical protein